MNQKDFMKSLGLQLQDTIERLLLIVVIVMGLVGLSACGQTGPLYLPDQAKKPRAGAAVAGQNNRDGLRQQDLANDPSFDEDDDDDDDDDDLFF